MPTSTQRSPTLPRPIHITYPHLARVDGSAQFSFGAPFSSSPTTKTNDEPSTSALASTSGPIEVRLASEDPTKATLDVTVRPLSGIPATEAKALGVVLKGVLGAVVLAGMHPRTMVQIVVQGISGGGGRGGGDDALTAAMINASSLSLLNAGSVPMRGIICAVPIGRRRADGKLLVDPEAREKLDVHGCFAFVVTVGKGGERSLRCVWSNWRGEGFDESALAEAIEMAAGAAGVVYEAMYESVVVGGKEALGAAEVKAKGKGKAADNNEVEEADDDKMEI
ncbi:Exosome complex component RRP46 [Hypsizygus marmoreus]|uniref:Exosome complex component RRP46 n=1 Tax=Hypsizygus marmoreus TaxID=39966 RepID=A0A369JMG8_HYPMA|nr:Exosome complex component RRP46 [Hypsizygus marmoreus]